MQAWLSRVASAATGGGKRRGEESLFNTDVKESPLGSSRDGSRVGRFRPGSMAGDGGLPLSAEDMARGRQITIVCEAVVLEIQRILRSAKEAHDKKEMGQLGTIQLPVRWAGTDDLLNLLSGGAPDPAGQAPGSGRPSAPRPSGEQEGHTHPRITLGCLEPLIDHPQFASRCLDAALAPNLGHCLRLMRVLELEDASPCSSSPSDRGMTPPLTADATARIRRLLVRLCQEGAVAEQLRHPLEGLFKLSTAPYPPRGGHVQAAALEVIEAISSRALSSSLVWFIHDRQIVLHMVDDLMDLCHIADGQEGGKTGGSLDTAAAEDDDPLVNCLLLGPEAEAAGSWLLAAKAVITLVAHSARYSVALLDDLQEAGGYDLFRSMLRRSSPAHRSELLAALVPLVGAGPDGQVARTGGNQQQDPGALNGLARNFAAFEVLRDVFVDATPVLRTLLTAPVMGNERLDEAKKEAIDGPGPLSRANIASSAVKKSPSGHRPQLPQIDLMDVARQSIQFYKETSATTNEGEKGKIESREELQMQLLNTLLQVYSNNPHNYALLEPRFMVLSLYLACLSSFLSPDLKLIVIKTLEYVCSGVANCAPVDALRAAAYTFRASCENFLEDRCGPFPEGVRLDENPGTTVHALNKTLRENVELVCGTLEKLIQFDHHFVEVLGTTDVMGDVLYPLLNRAVDEAKRVSTDMESNATCVEDEQQLIVPPSKSTGSKSMVRTPEGVDQVVCLCCRVLLIMLQETPTTASQLCREAHLQHALYAVIGELGLHSTQAALRVLQTAALADPAGLREDLTCFIELLQSCREERWRQLVVLKSIKEILLSDSTVNDLWRSFCGFEAVVAALSSLDGAFGSEMHESSEIVIDAFKDIVVSDEENQGGVTMSEGAVEDSRSTVPLTPETQVHDTTTGEAEHFHNVLYSGQEQLICLELIIQIIRIITIAISGKVLGNLRARVENRQYLKNEIGYDTLKCCLLNSKVLTHERFSREIVKCIFMMVTEEASFNIKLKGFRQATVKNADAALLLFSLLKELPRSVAGYILQKLLQLIANSTYVAAEQLCSAGALRQVLVQFYDILNDPEDPLYGHLLRLLYLSGRHRVTVPDTISMLRCLGRPLFLNKDGAIVLCPSFRRQMALHPELARRRRPALDEQWKSLLILAELAETSDSVPFLRLGGGRGDLLALSRKWASEEPKEIGIMDFDSVYAATAYSEGMRFVMVPTVGGAQSSASSSGFSYSCWFRFGVEGTDFAVSTCDEDTEETGTPTDAGVPGDADEGCPLNSAGITQQILWLFTVSSTSAKSSLQIYLDLTHRQLCVESYVSKGLDTELIPVDLESGKWHHFLLVHRRARNLLSNAKSTLNVYLNGMEVAESFKTDHVSFLESPTSRCFIGVPLPDTLKVSENVLRGAVAPIWHMGPIILTQEALPAPQAATAIYVSGPSYLGSFQGERPVQNSIHATVTALLARLHNGGAAPTPSSTAGVDTISALLARGLQDVLRIDHRRTREEEALAALLSLRIPLEHVVFSFHAAYASPCEITPRHLSGGSNQNLDIYHEPCYRLVNTIGHLCEEARAQWGVVFGDGALMNPLSISDSIFGIAGPQVLFPLLEVADSCMALCVVLELVRVFCRGHAANLEYMQETGYRVMVFLLARKKDLFTPDVLRACLALAVDTNATAKNTEGESASEEGEPLAPALAQRTPYSSDKRDNSPRTSLNPSPHCMSGVLVDAAALKHLVLNWELWGSNQDHEIVIALLAELHGLLSPENPNAVFNAYRLHYLGLVRWTLSVMMQAVKLSSVGQEGGWVLPRITYEDAHWAQTSVALPDKLLMLCGNLLEQLLLTRMAENDVNDIASVLLSTVAQPSSSRGDLGETIEGITGSNSTNGSMSFRPAAQVVNISALKFGSKDVLSAQSIVRIYLLNILIKVLAREHESRHQTRTTGGQGVVRKVMDFFSLETERKTGKIGVGGGISGNLAPAAAASNASTFQRGGSVTDRGPNASATQVKNLFREDDHEISKALSRCMSPDWFHAVLASCRDALSISLTLRALFILFQERDDFVVAFSEYDTGFVTLGSFLPSISASPVVLMPLLAVILGVPMVQLPSLTNLEEIHLYELLDPLIANGHEMRRLSRPLFGALMSALMESLNRNLHLSRRKDSVEVRKRAKYCVEGTLECVKRALEDSVEFMQLSKSKEFLSPVVQSVYACEDVVDTLQKERQTSGGLSPIYHPDEKTVQSGGTAEVTTGDVADNPDVKAFFEATEAQRLLLLVTLVLQDSFFTPAGFVQGTSASAQVLVREVFLAFPHTASEMHIHCFYRVFLTLLQDLVKEAFSSGDSIPVGNVVAVCCVLFEMTKLSLLPIPLLSTALDLTLKAAREISGTRINKSMGNDLQQVLLTDLITIGQAFSIVALRRTRQGDASLESASILSIVHAHLHLLLSHSKRLGGPNSSAGLNGAGAVASGGITPSLRAGTSGVPLLSSHGGKWRKALASSMSMDEAGMETALSNAGVASLSTGAPSTPLDISKSVHSLSAMLSRPLDAGNVTSRMHEVCVNFGPDKDEPFVICLLNELNGILLDEKYAIGGGDGSRRLAARICEVLLKQRENVMTELFNPESRDKQIKGSKEKRFPDIISEGFYLLLPAKEVTSMNSSGRRPKWEDDAVLRLDRFERWFTSAEARSDILHAFRPLQDRALALLPDEPSSTDDVLHRLRAAKVPAFSLGQSSAHDRLTRGEHLNVRKAFETFINFHQHIIRSGLADIANGSWHWKEVLRSLRGVASVWEGVDVQEGNDEDRWATANSEAAEVVVRSLQQRFRWKLDLSEGPERMRRRLQRNYEFEEVYNVLERPSLEEISARRLPLGVSAALNDEEGKCSDLYADDEENPLLSSSPSTSSLDDLMHDMDFDLRATTKFIKQVALVHKSSGISGRSRNSGHGEDYDEDDLFDSYGEGADGPRPFIDNAATSPRALEVDAADGGPDMRESTPSPDQQVAKNFSTAALGEEDAAVTVDASSTTVRNPRTTGGLEDLGATACPFHESPVSDACSTRLERPGSVREPELMSSTSHLKLVRDTCSNSSLSSLPPALRSQVSLADIDSSNHLQASGSLALLAMEAAVSDSKDRNVVANELIAGFVDESDGPILRLYNVQRCTGLEVSPALLLFCRHSLVIVDGFVKASSDEAQSSTNVVTIKRVSCSFSTSPPPASLPAAGSQGDDGKYKTETTENNPISKEHTGDDGEVTGCRKVKESGSSSARSGEDIDDRFKVYLRAPSRKSNDLQPSAEALLTNSMLDNTQTSAFPSKVSAKQPGEDDTMENRACSLTRIGFDLENPPHVERMRFDRLRILYKRRYQFRHVAVEFFDVDGRSFLIALETPAEQTQVVDLVLDAPLVNSVFWSNNQDGALQKLGGGGRINYKRFMSHWRQQLTTRWQSGRMTNFEYLMHLNALAGRSFHDLTQYPVFPWVLSDYTSPTLDLNNPEVYRDLRKPMGALGESRAKQFQERFEQLASLVEDMAPEEAAGEAPPFHYGTHYSCAGYVLYYLLRLEPYARLHLQLQGGKFDKADRLFRDIKSSWDSASHENLQDVRELIPEFFYLPDFLTNHNQFDYGWLQKGLDVNHVMLPPWAKGDAREFVRLQRMALESKHVSENLCHWIDLIFGCKQTGPEAEKSQNLFVHLTYEGVVDIDAIQDPVVREATIAQIHNFGQTPSRLFKRSHPARRVPLPLQSQQLDEASVTMMAGTSGNIAGLGGNTAGSAIVGGNASTANSALNSTGLQRSVDISALNWHQFTTPSLCIVGAPQTIALRPAATSQLGAPHGGALPSPTHPVGDVWAVKDRPVGVGLDCLLVPPSLVKYARYGSPDNGLAFRVAIPTTRHQYVDRVVSVHEQLHLGPVNCLALDEAGELAVTGSLDSTLRVWSLAKHNASAPPTQLYSNAGGGGKTLSLQATLCGHSSEVLCVDVAAELGILLSGGADRVAVVWDVRDFTSQRLLVGHAAPVISVSINKLTGDMVTLGGVDVRVWSVTGELLAQVSAIAVVKEVPTCAVATGCPEWLNGVVAVTGHDNGKLCLWGLHHLSDDEAGQRLDRGASAAGAREERAWRGGKCMDGDDLAGAGAEVDLGSNTGTTQGRQLKVMQILQGIHTAAITAIRVGKDQRGVTAGDAAGKCSRWTSMRLDQMPERELVQLTATARRK